ncbi:MAG: hypothetical protein ACE366_11565 [Bradymonadia bacterium]
MKTLISSLLLCASALLVPLSAFACDCGYGGSFEELASKGDLAIRAKVLSYGPWKNEVHGTTIYRTMDVQVLDVLKGESQRKRIRLMGDDGRLCRPYITTERFPIGSEMLFVLDQSRGFPIPISNCGEFWLQVKDGRVNTCRKGGKQDCSTLPVADLVKRLKGSARSGVTP